MFGFVIQTPTPGYPKHQRGGRGRNKKNIVSIMGVFYNKEK